MAAKSTAVLLTSLSDTNTTMRCAPGIVPDSRPLSASLLAGLTVEDRSPPPIWPRLVGGDETSWWWMLAALRNKV